jgi:glycosyltransferase involved in cell wall biosynthesis
MHFHGMWMMPNVYPANAVRGTDCKLVMSPRGMMEPWALSWNARRKQLFGAVFQYRALQSVDAFNATSKGEAESIRMAGFTAPVAVIPIGIDIPHGMHDRGGARRLAVYLGRLHPKKNLEALIDAWGRVEMSHPEWDRVIAGPGDADYVQGLVQRAGSTEHLTVTGAAFGDDKAQLLESSELFVFPTLSENFGIVVAEALSYGLPVIASTGSPWAEIATRGCGWWVDPSLDSLAAALDGVLSEDRETLRARGAIGRTWMEDAYSWHSVASRTSEFYGWLIDDRAGSPASIV